MKKRFFALILACAGLMSLEAATVSVLVVEAGLPPGSESTASALMWESGMMDAFFDAGHIVFNAPAMQVADVSGSMPPEVSRDFDEARIGGAEFFVLVVLNYSLENPEQIEEPPKEIIIRIFKVSTGDVFYETSLAVKVWGSSDDVFFDAKQNAGKILSKVPLKG